MIAASGWLLTAGAAVGLVAAERRGSSHRRLWKPLASAGFLVVAWSEGLPSSAYASWVSAGLILSYAGDVLLLGSSDGAFRAGLAAFLAAHLAYVGGFATAPLDGSTLAMAAVLAAVAGIAVGRWLLPSVPGAFGAPVVAYMAAITAMVIVAWGAGAGVPDPRIAAGATLFYASDLAVARNRFLVDTWINRLWGLPFYYAGQLLIASTV